MPTAPPQPVPRWRDIQADPRFGGLDTGQRMATHRQWQGDWVDQMNREGTWTPENYANFVAGGHRTRASLISPDTPVSDEEVMRRVEADENERTDRIARAEKQRQGLLGDDDERFSDAEIALLEDVNRGKRNTTGVGGILHVNPALYFGDKPAFTKAINAETLVPPEEKARAISEYETMREVFGKQKARNLIRNSLDARSFHNQNPGLEGAEFVEAYREARHPALSTIEAITTGIADFGAEIPWAVAAVANKLGLENIERGAQEMLADYDAATASIREAAADAGSSGLWFDASRTISGLVPSMAAGFGAGAAGRKAAKEAAKRMTKKGGKRVAIETADEMIGDAVAGAMRKMGVPKKLTPQTFSQFASLAGFAAEGGAKSAALTYHEAYEGIRDQLEDQGLKGKNLEREALRQAANSSLRAGAVTSALTMAFGATGVEKMAKLHSIAKNPAAQGRFKEGLKTVFKEAGFEAGEEGLDEAVNGAFDALEFNPDMTADEWAFRVGFGASLGAALGGISATVAELAGPVGYDQLRREGETDEEFTQRVAGQLEQERQTTQLEANLDNAAETAAELRTEGSDELADAVEQSVESQLDQMSEELAPDTEQPEVEPTPGSRQSIERFGVEEDAARTFEALQQGAKPIALVNPRFWPEDGIEGLATREIEVEGAEGPTLAVFPDSEAGREALARVEEIGFPAASPKQDAELGRALGYTEPEIEEFLSTPADQDAEQDQITEASGVPPLEGEPTDRPGTEETSPRTLRREGEGAQEPEEGLLDAAAPAPKEAAPETEAADLEGESPGPDPAAVTAFGQRIGLDEETAGAVTTHREAVSRRMAQAFPEMTDTDAEAASIVVDTAAKAWGRANNKSDIAWYEENLGAIRSIDADTEVDPQTGEQIRAKGFTTIENGKAVITAMKRGDTTTALHEFFHAFENSMSADLRQQLMDAYGATEWTTAEREKAARDWEQYLRTGEAPMPELQGVFDYLKDLFRQVYASIRDIPGISGQDVRRVFDEMLGVTGPQFQADVAPTGRTEITPEQDAAYLSAVAEGDMGTAQAMVDEAAAGAVDAIHGTPQQIPITIFDPDMRGKGKPGAARSARLAFWFSDSADIGRTYAGKPPANAIADIQKEIERLKRPDALERANALEGWGDLNLTQSDLDEQLGRAQESLVRLQKQEASGQLLPVKLFLGDNVRTFDFEGDAPDVGILGSIVEQAKADGVTGLVFKNIDDPASAVPSGVPQTHYAVFDSNQIKSAGPVTRDADGNVVPLSQRFNPESPSILFQEEVRKGWRSYKTDEEIDEAIRERMGEEGEAPASTYQPIGNAETAQQMIEVVDANGLENSATILKNQGFLDKANKRPGEKELTYAQEVLLANVITKRAGAAIKRLRALGNAEADPERKEAIEAEKDALAQFSVSVVEHISERGTKLGQGVQAFAAFGYLTPEGALRLVRNRINKKRERLGETQTRKDVQTEFGMTAEGATDEINAEIRKETRKAEQDTEQEKSDEARRLIERFSKIHSDTLAWAEGRSKEQKQTLTKLINQHIREPVADFTEQAQSLGATEEQAGILDTIAGAERNRRDIEREVRADQQQRARANESAERLIGRYAAIFSDTLDFSKNPRSFSIADLVRQYVRGQTDTKGRIPEDQRLSREDLVTQLQERGVTAENAERLAGMGDIDVQRVRANEQARATEARQRGVENFLKRFEGKDRPRKELGPADKDFIRAIVNATEVGAVQTEQFLDIFESKFGARLKPKDVEKINELAEKAEEAPEGFLKHNAARQLLAEMARIEGISAADVATAMWYANILSGLNTQAINIFGSGFHMALRALSAAAASPKSALPMLKAMFSARTRKQARQEFTNTFARGENIIKAEQKYQQPNILQMLGEMEDSENLPLALQNKKVRKAVSMWDYVFRTLQAFDGYFYRTSAEGYAALAAARLANKKKGVTSEQLARDIHEELYNLGGVEADVRAQAVADVEAIMPGASDRAKRNAVDRRVFEVMEQNRPPDVREQADHFGKMTTFTQEPDGMFGLLAQQLNGLIERVRWPRFQKVEGKWALERAGDTDVRPIKFAIPFVNIVANVGNAALDFTPWGIVRSYAGGGHVFSGRQKNMTKEQRLEQRISGMVGSAGAAMLHGLAEQYMDDEDPFFAISAMGPDDAGKRRQMMSQGWKPFTIKVGDTYWKYNETPLAMLFSMIGAMHDDRRYGKANDRDWVEKINLYSIFAAKAFSEAGFLSSVKDVLDLVTGDVSAGSTTKGVLSLPARVAKGFVPAQGLLRDTVTRLREPEIIDNDSIWATLVRDVPFAQQWGTRPMLNAFGEPVKRSWLERTPVAARFGSIRTNDPAWDYLAKNQLWVPGMGRVTVALPGASRSTKAAIKRLQAKRAENLGRMASEVMTEAEAYEYLKQAGAKTREIVERYAERYPEPDERQREFIQSAINREAGQARSQVKAQMLFEQLRD